MSITFDTMGHFVAETNLRDFLPERYEHIEYRSKLFSEIKKEMGWPGRLVLLTSYPIFPSFKYDIFITRFRSEMAYSLLVFLYFLKIEKNDIDVFHFRTQSICFLVQLFFKKYKSVVTIDMTAHQLIKLRPHNKLFYYPITWIESMIFNRAYAVVTYSDFAGNSVKQDYNVSAKKVKTIHPAVRDSFFLSGAKVSSISPRILFVGNDLIRKGGDLLLEVFNKHFRGRAELDIVSNDSLLTKMPVPEGVCFHRNVQSNSVELINLYRNAHCFVLPTREEAYGIVFCEAMAASLPCIGTLTMAIPELIENGVNGFCVPIDDEESLRQKIEILIENKELWKMMSENSRTKADKNFGLTVHLSHYKDVFELQ